MNTPIVFSMKTMIHKLIFLTCTTDFVTATSTACCHLRANIVERSLILPPVSLKLDLDYGTSRLLKDSLVSGKILQMKWAMGGKKSSYARYCS